jgi:YggT family protein
MNLNPFINLIGSALSIYSFLLFIYLILHFLFMFKIINPYSQIVQTINRFLSKIFEPVLNKLRRYIPNFNGIDLSPLALFLLIGFAKDILYAYFYTH